MQISVIIPCLNEEKTIAKCVMKAQEGIAQWGDEGEILVIDNGSTDNTKNIAINSGARVITVHKRGYGNAIRSGLLEAQGTYVVTGDGDDSYDFRIIPSLISHLKQSNYDLVIGNRFTGDIKPGAMPFLNRYFGNPFLSGVGRILFGNVCGDFHCGLRVGKRESLTALNLSATHMELTTEMIIKAAIAKLKISEIPITLYKDGRGRPPHMRRWRDGLICLIFMFRYRFFPKSF